MWRTSLLYCSYLLRQLPSLKTHSLFADLMMEELLCAYKACEISKDPSLLMPVLVFHSVTVETEGSPIRSPASLIVFNSCSLIFLGYVLPIY